MTLAHRVGPLFDRIAPPKSGRAHMLRYGYRTVRSLFKPQDAARRIRAVRDSSRLYLDVLLHRDALARQQPWGSAHWRWRSALIRTHSANRPRFGQVLVIDHRIPTADRDCGSLRMIEIIRAIKGRGHHVTFIPDNMLVFSPYLEELERLGVEVVRPPYFGSVADYLKRHGRDFSLAIVSRADVAQRHIETVRRYAPGPGSSSTPWIWRTCGKSARRQSHTIRSSVPEPPAGKSKSFDWPAWRISPWWSARPRRRFSRTSAVTGSTFAYCRRSIPKAPRFRRAGTSVATSYSSEALHTPLTSTQSSISCVRSCL